MQDSKLFLVPPTIALPGAPAVPAGWVTRVDSQLLEEEHVLAWLQTDLSPRLYYTPGFVVITDKRILATTEREGVWQGWFYRQGLRLARSDHSGVGSLELFDDQSLLTKWRYTLGNDGAVGRLIESFARQLSYHVTGEQRPAQEVHLCPRCQRVLDAPLPPGQDECEACIREASTPPSTWTLLRLWRFAKPYKMRLLAGFLLTIGSTGATLVPPYLTMPLMDNVLIPYQNGKPIDVDLVTFYLTGLLGAALLAWVLGWSRTYILALVSERIGADLRTAAYEHLLKLSQAYFAGKRTG